MTLSTDRSEANVSPGSQKYVLLYLTLFVVVTSFSYGLVQGFRQTASASGASMDSQFFSLTPQEENVFLPEGAKVVSLGSDTKINNNNIEIVNFFTSGQIDQFIHAQQQRWGQRGLQPINRVSSKRAVSVAVDRNSGKRYSLIVWRVPPIARKFSEGYSLQGILAISGMAQTELEPGREIPGVPLMPGGTSGTVFSSEEFNGRSYTASYSNPGSIEDNIQFYRNELPSSGWRYREALAPSMSGAATPLRLLEFSNAREELTLLFSGINGDQRANKTLVTVVRAPKSPRTS